MGCTTSKHRKNQDNNQKNCQLPNRVLQHETSMPDLLGDSRATVRALDESTRRSRSLSARPDPTQSDESNEGQTNREANEEQSKKESEKKNVVILPKDQELEHSELVKSTPNLNEPVASLHKSHTLERKVDPSESRRREEKRKRLEQEKLKREQEQKTILEDQQKQKEETKKKEELEKALREERMLQKLRQEQEQEPSPPENHASERRTGDATDRQSPDQMPSAKAPGDQMKSRKAEATSLRSKQRAALNQERVPAIIVQKEAVRQAQQSCINRRDRVRYAAEDDTLFEVPPHMPVVDFT